MVLNADVLLCKQVLELCHEKVFICLVDKHACQFVGKMELYVQWI